MMKKWPIFQVNFVDSFMYYSSLFIYGCLFSFIFNFSLVVVSGPLNTCYGDLPDLEILPMMPSPEMAIMVPLVVPDWPDHVPEDPATEFSTILQEFKRYKERFLSFRKMQSGVLYYLGTGRPSLKRREFFIFYSLNIFGKLGLIISYSLESA